LGIENNLHWVKDVNMGEDDMTLLNKNMVSLLVYLNNIALNVLKMADANLPGIRLPNSPIKSKN
jgi:predicted transposase YbfD/YdcC